MSRPYVGPIIPVSQVLWHWGNLAGETRPEYPKSCAGRPEKKSSLQLFVSHQMRPYFSAIVLRGLSYTCFIGTWVLGQFGKTGAKYPTTFTGTPQK